jgi:hypothetical protein
MSTEQWVANTISVVSPAGGGGNGGDGVAFNDDVTLIVEMGFGDGVYDDPTWTDITAYVRGFTTSRGRDFAGDPVGPGTATMTLDNLDGRFDPTYTGGAYYPDILPMVQTRIRANYDIPGAIELDHGSHGQLGDPLQSGTVGIWRGYASSWPQTWPGNVDATVPVGLVDATKLLNLNYAASWVAGFRLFGIESSGKRLDHILDDADWPTDWRHIPIGTIAAPAKAYGETVLAAIREISEMEQGIVVVSPDGKLGLIPYNDRASRTSQVTFGDGPGEAPYTGLELAYDDDQIWNRAEIGTITGGPLAAVDISSQVLFGTRTIRNPSPASLFGNLGFDGDDWAQSQGDRLIATYKDPSVRVEQLTFLPSSDPEVLWPVALGLDIGSKLTVKRRPPAGNTITVDCYVEGITHRVTVGGMWETVFMLSQYE